MSFFHRRHGLDSVDSLINDTTFGVQGFHFFIHQFQQWRTWVFDLKNNVSVNKPLNWVIITLYQWAFLQK